MRKTPFAAALALLLCSAAAHANAPVAPTSWELSGEFNATPPGYANGVWTYGAIGGGACAITNLMPLTTHVHNGQIQGHRGSGPAASAPNILQNQALVPTTASPNLVFPPRAVALRPGASVCAVVRFTAPTAGNYHVSGRFYGLDPNGTGTDVEVYLIRTNLAVFTYYYDFYAHLQLIGGAPDASFTSIDIPLAVGDTLDFAVDANGSNAYDTTGLHAVVELDP